MTKHDELKEAALAAVEALNSDTSVDKDTTVASLDEVCDRAEELRNQISDELRGGRRMSEQTQAPEAVPLFEESYTGAALDGARIAVGTALILVSLDHTLSDTDCIQVMKCLEQAQGWLDRARQAFPQSAPATSIHVVHGSTPGGLIIP